MKKQFRSSSVSLVISRLMFLSVFLMCTAFAYAQSKVKGRVTDAKGEAIIGASILVKGTNNGAITDIDGNYNISNVPSKGSLVVSYVGYVTQTVAVNGKNVVNIVLKEDALNLEEVVVVGYGVQRKTDVTGAMTRVGAKELNAKPVSNAFEALQGKAAGVDITSNQRPGEIGDIRIRGNRSLTASNSPLYVVDGVPLSSGGIETLNPRDIESIDILKDASSTAIYGSRGANGVVLVTTKRGKQGAMQLNYSGSVTFEKIVDKSPAMSASDYITWRRWAYYNSNPTANPMGNEPNFDKDQAYFAGDAAALANVNKGWNADHTQWDGSKVTESFKTQMPWIGMDEDYKLYNVESELKDETSIYHFYRSLIQFRKKTPALIYGSFKVLDESVKDLFTYVRKLEGERYYIECNLSDHCIKRIKKITGFKRLLSNYKLPYDVLRPYEANLYQF